MTKIVTELGKDVLYVYETTDEKTLEKEPDKVVTHKFRSKAEYVSYFFTNKDLSYVKESHRVRIRYLINEYAQDA